MSVPTGAAKSADRYIGGWWAGWFLGVIDDMKLFDRAVTEDEILTHLHGRATRADPVTAIDPSLRLTRRQLRVSVTMRNVAALPATIDLHVRPAIRQPLQIDSRLAGRATATATFDLSGVVPGEYELRCGELASANVRVPETPPWFGTDVGKAERPLPFTPVQRDGNVVRVIGREVRLTDAGLIAQITAAGEELLARPMHVSTDGDVTCTAEVDYDGLVMMRCRVKGRATRLTLEVALRLSRARYLHVWAEHAKHGAEGLPLDRFRAEMMGVNWGVPADFLHYRLGDYNTACAIALLHDVTVRSYTPHHKKINGALYRLAVDFGRAEATFKPYWTNPVAGLPADCYASVYEHPRNGRLVLVSNLGREKATVSVAGTQVIDGLTRKQLPDGRVDLKPMGWRYLWVPGGAATPLILAPE